MPVGDPRPDLDIGDVLASVSPFLHGVLYNPRADERGTLDSLQRLKEFTQAGTPSFSWTSL